MLRNIPSAFALGALAICVLAVTPPGSAIAQNTETICQAQLETCKGREGSLRNACFQECKSSSTPDDCPELLISKLFKLPLTAAIILRPALNTVTLEVRIVNRAITTILIMTRVHL